MEIVNQTEAIMQAATVTETGTFRYGYDPKVMFAATRSGAARRAREAAAATAPSRPHLLRRLIALVGTPQS